MTMLDSIATTDIVTWLFFVTNTGRVLAYLPQIQAAWKCANGATSVSRVTWSYFAVAHLSGAIYGGVVAHDPGMAAIFLGNFAACVTLLLVITWKRRRHDAAPHGRLAGTAIPARPTR